MLDNEVLMLIQEIASDGDLASLRPELRNAALEILDKNEKEMEMRANHFLLHHQITRGMA